MFLYCDMAALDATFLCQVWKLRQKLFKIDDHIMVAATGITADAYELVGGWSCHGVIMVI